MILAANLIAMVVQTQSAKLGIATGKNLAELCRERFSRRTSIGLWIQAEVVAMATDIAEVVGAALGLNLLFGIPLFPAGLIAGAGAFAILALQQMGFRRLEAGITALVGVVVASFVFELFDAKPDGGRSRQAPLRPRLRRHREHPAGDRDHRRDGDAARHLPALGADPAADRRPRRRASSAGSSRFEKIDVVIAMSLAGRGQPLDDDRRRRALPRQRPGRRSTRSTAPTTGCKSLVSDNAATIFGIALLASGFASSSVGTMAGQVVMQGFIRRRIPIFVRRAITLAPALLVLGDRARPDRRPGRQPGRPLLRHPVRAGAAADDRRASAR